MAKSVYHVYRLVDGSWKFERSYKAAWAARRKAKQLEALGYAASIDEYRQLPLFALS